MYISARPLLPLLISAIITSAFGMVPRMLGSLSVLQQHPYRIYSKFGVEFVSSPISRPFQGRCLCFSSPNQGTEADPPALCTFTVKELQNLCRAAKLPVSGRKSELITRLEQSQPDYMVAKSEALPIAEGRPDEAAGLRAVMILACKS